MWAVFNYKLRWRSPNLAPHPKIEFLCDREHPGWRAATPPTGAMGNCINRVQSRVEMVSPLSLFARVFGEHDAGLFVFVKKVSVEVRYALLHCFWLARECYVTVGECWTFIVENCCIYLNILIEFDGLFMGGHKIKHTNRSVWEESRLFGKTSKIALGVIHKSIFFKQGKKLKQSTITIQL